MAVYSLTRPDNPTVEFRLAADSFFGCTRIDQRELNRDGQPYDDKWYRLTDSGWLWLQNIPGGTYIIDQLHKEQAETS